jgi:hypothetical protein
VFVPRFELVTSGLWNSATHFRVTFCCEHCIKLFSELKAKPTFVELIKVLWRINSLLRNNSVSKFRRKPTHTARQRISTHASLTIEAVFSAWSVQSAYKEVFSSIGWSEESSFKTGYQLALEFSRLFGTGSCRNIKTGIRLWQADFMCDLKWQWDFVNPLPGYGSW